jgi:hypothetical protein
LDEDYIQAAAQQAEDNESAKGPALLRGSGIDYNDKLHSFP